MHIYNVTKILYKDSNGLEHFNSIYQTSNEMFFEYKNRVKRRMEELRAAGYIIIKIKEN